MGITSLNICSLEDVTDILLVTDFPNCSRAVGGWFEFFLYTLGCHLGSDMFDKYNLLN